MSFREGYSLSHLRVNSVELVFRTADSIRRKGMTRMKMNGLIRTLTLLAVAALAIPAFAKPVSKTFNITQAAKVGKVDLQAGEYRLLIDGTKATVQKGNTVIAQSEGRWEERETKSNYDAVLVGENGQVKEVRFSGQKRVFVFNE